LERFIVPAPPGMLPVEQPAAEIRSSGSGTAEGTGGDMAKDHGPSVKNDEQYEELRKKGESKEKAARIANSSSSKAGKRGGKSGSYEDWSKQDLQERAREIGIEGRSKMNKGDLIHALRNH
jgi:hypothetical protein